jgi:hypothetical protein
VKVEMLHWQRLRNTLTADVAAVPRVQVTVLEWCSSRENRMKITKAPPMLTKVVAVIETVTRIRKKIMTRQEADLVGRLLDFWQGSNQ